MFHFYRNTEIFEKFLKKEECPQCNNVEIFFLMPILMPNGLCYNCHIENNTKECRQCNNVEILTNELCSKCIIKNNTKECPQCNNIKVLTSGLCFECNMENVKPIQMYDLILQKNAKN